MQRRVARRLRSEMTVFFIIFFFFQFFKPGSSFETTHRIRNGIRPTTENTTNTE